MGGRAARIATTRGGSARWHSSVVERHLGKVEVQGSSPCASSGGTRASGDLHSRPAATGARVTAAECPVSVTIRTGGGAFPRPGGFDNRPRVPVTETFFFR